MGCYVSGAKGFKADHKKVSGEIMTCSSCFLYFFVIFSVGWGCHPPNTCGGTQALQASPVKRANSPLSGCVWATVAPC